MPIYQYRCESCGVSFERIQSFSDEPLTDCPECEGKVHRVIQPVGIIFKGSGFYVTDNRTSSALPPGKKNGKGTDSGDSGVKSEVGEKKDTDSKA